MQISTRQVLHLHKPPCPSSGTVCAVKLQQTSDAAVLAHGSNDRAVLLDTRLGKQLPQLQHAGNVRLELVLVLECVLYRCAPQVGNGNAVPLQPGQHLLTALGILQTGQLDGFLFGCFLDRRAAVQRTVHQLPVGCNTAGADPHIVLPLTLHPLGHRETAQAVLDLHFGHNVLPVVLNEQLPLRRIMSGQVARAAAVGDRLSARRAEILDKSLAGRQLLLVLRQTECLAGGIQTCRIPAVQAVQHGAAPLFER